LREIAVSSITEAVRDLCIEANTRLPQEHLSALSRALEAEKSELGREVIERLLENAEVARERCIAFCQDTGYAVFFVELGSEVRISGGEIGAAIDEGVRRGYEEGYLRKSIVMSPIDRTNTGDNTPAVVYYEPVQGDGLKLTMLVKGAGCDNMSALKMLTPAEGLQAMKRFVVETIERAGPNASPPLTVGVGIGGPFEKAAVLAKKALTRPSGEPNPDPDLAIIERELVDEINATGIGPAGYGGTQTALAVHIESFPTHIAAFPVAVNLDCHSQGNRTSEDRRRRPPERGDLHSPRCGPRQDETVDRSRRSVAAGSGRKHRVLLRPGPGATGSRVGTRRADDRLQDGPLRAAPDRTRFEGNDRQGSALRDGDRVDEGARLRVLRGRRGYGGTSG
jgi:fumarate hydratase subunit alpha